MIDRPIDAHAEMQAAALRITQPHLDRIQALGIALALLAKMGAKFPPIGVVEATPNPDGMTYEPGAGPLHVCIPIIEAGQVIDIVAFRTIQPEKWLLRSGVGWALGADCLAKRWDYDAAVELHDTPLNWLRYGGKGLCITDWGSPEVRKLIEVERFEVANAALGKALLDALSKPVRLPSIEHRRALHVA